MFMLQKNRLKRVIVSITFLVIIALGFIFAFPVKPLSEIHRLVVKNYPTVNHISLDEYAQIDVANTLVFDVREVDEFQVSHLPGAILIDPDTDAEDFIEDYGDQLQGKHLVFYCSVGRRSSEMISRLHGDVNVAQQLSRAASTRNLKGGAFAWINAQRSLQNANAEPTSKVHPFNEYWGRLILDSDNRQY